MKKISKGNAAALGMRFYYTGKPCKNGHVDFRYVSDGRCVSCRKQAALDYKRKRAQNVKSYDREYSRRYRSRNSHKVSAYVMERHAKKLQRTPQWANLALISKIYAQARLATIVTGWPHHVDHIVPLQGRCVSGLHVENNLQILPDDENISKGNRFR